jgi:hypothetical protein
VELGNVLGEPLHHRTGEGPPPEQPVHHPLRGQAAHVHRVLEGSALSAHPDAGRRFGDRDDAEVEVGAEAAVEPHLLLAEVEALGEPGHVHEGETHRLLQLVDEVTGPG